MVCSTTEDLKRRFASECRVDPLPIIVELDVTRNRVTRLDFRREMRAVDHLVLQTGVERFGECVVPANTGTADRRSEAVYLQYLTILIRHVLTGTDCHDQNGKQRSSVFEY